MKLIKKTLAVVLSAMFVVLCFAGCSSASKETEEITSETMLIAYSDEKAPFIYTDESGNLAGFDVEIINQVFEDVKNDYKNYRFVKVDSDYRVGEDAAYTDENGNDYIAYVMVGGLEKDKGSFNKDFTFTNEIITNRVVAVTAQGSAISTYADLQGKSAGIVSDVAADALDENTAIKNNLASVQEYDDESSALNDLKDGKIDVLITDEFNFCAAQGKDDFVVLDGELDSVGYVYSFKKWDWYVEAFNEAIYELQSPDYNDADQFTPIVEKYFNYDASSFDFQPENN